MLKWLLKRRIDAFEKEYDYDASHMRYVLDVSVAAALKFGRIKGLANYPRWPRIAVRAANLWSQWASAKVSHRSRSRQFWPAMSVR